ncbi:MAG: dihydrolipoyl dehydrogenase [Actinomycetales bacterium]|uniref:Dihydrolipoyl dehydrogenase n=1 Tax=Candidatus Phosphoribacter hodrii TaxID=2953743 RepID=A0A934X528_9MICO|nr:dihydrolipoyl dehydrogenase [Candidatus Phosphoribacter hodrii]
MTDEAPDIYDVLVLGGGSGGYACALRSAQLGLRVALIERDKLGGTCLHRGCIPTKALLHAAEVADTAREGARFGVNSSVESIDMSAVLRYQQGVVSRLHKGLQGLVSAATIDYVDGFGEVTSPTTVRVGDRTLTGRRLVLATGSRARSLPGLEIGGRVLTSDQALGLTQVPTSVIVLGGGVIGVEFASVFRSFGASVTIIEALPRLVPAEEESISKALERAFRKRGIVSRTNARFASVAQDDASVTVSLEDGSTLSADLLLVAVGREPVSDGMGFQEAGVLTDRGFVPTDERLRTNIPGVYAVGDLVPGLQLAHRGFAHGVFVAEDIASLNPAPVLDRNIPKVTYCDPEIASVGLTEAAARAEHGEVRAYEYNLGGNGKSQILGTSGFVSVVRVVDGPVVGIHMIGARMGEQIGEAQLVVGWDAMPEDVAPLVHAHPTQNEALGEAHLALAGKPLHAHA